MIHIPRLGRTSCGSRGTLHPLPVPNTEVCASLLVIFGRFPTVEPEYDEVYLKFVQEMKTSEDMREAVMALTLFGVRPLLDAFFCIHPAP